jgi:hypothetical protein
VVGYDKTEYGVAQELETLIGRPTRILGTPGSMAERLDEERPVFDGPAQADRESVLQLGALIGGAGARLVPGTGDRDQLASSLAMT